MNLSNALLVLAASAMQAAATEPAKPSVLPPDCGLTEAQVLDLSVPQLSMKRADPKTHDDTGVNADFFDAEIVDALTTDFHSGYGSFLVVAVNIRRGQCDYCQFTTLAVIDRVTRELAWKYDDQGISRHREEKRALRVFRVFPDDPVLTLVYRFDSIGCQYCGAGRIEEHWLRPRLTSESALVFDTVWQGAVNFRDSGQPNGAGFFGEVETSLTSLWPKHAYRLRRTIPTGWLAHPGTQESPFTPCKETKAECCSVEFEFSRDLEQDPVTHTLSPTNPGRWRRHDSRATSTFPYNLKVARLDYDQPIPADNIQHDLREVASPDGSLVVRKHGGLQLESRAGGQPLRTIPDPDCGHYDVRAIGWSRDGHRALAVIDPGLPDMPPILVSLAPVESGDRWEGFLAPGTAIPSDGFILDLQGAEAGTPNVIPSH